MRRDDPRLRARLWAALASAIALAFVVTVAAVASAPAPQQSEGAAPPSATGPSRPTTTSATSEPRRDRTVDRTLDRTVDRSAGARDDVEQDRPAHDEPPEAEAPQDPEPAPAAEPSPPPRTEEPRATPDAEAAPLDHGARLWGRWFRADEIREGDVRVLVAGDQPLYVGFVRQEGGDGLVWMTSCNTFGGELTVGRRRLRVRDIGGTAVGCEDDNLHDQEEWLEGFFGARPRWLTAGDQLRMWTPDGRRIDLVGDPEGPGPPWS